MCAEVQRSKLRKSPPGTGHALRHQGWKTQSSGWPSGPQKAVMESRTMALARRTAAEDVVRLRVHQTDEHVDTPPQALTTYYFNVIQRYIGNSTQAVSQFVSTSEYHWALRATRAEALLDAHAAHHKEWRTVEERRSQELAALNERYARQLATHQRVMWISVAAVILAVSMLSVILYRQHRPAAEASRWLGPMHFTIPILSPFASVIEHETSAVNVQLVAVLVVFAGIFGFLWYRCAPRRR